MLKQLTNLTIEADGRYATEEELQFIKDYLSSVEQRISAYEKIRDAEAEIIEQVKAKMRSVDPHIFLKGNKDVTEICRRDTSMTLRHSAAAMLINDLDRLREGLLLWQKTIVHAFKNEHVSEITYQVMSEVIKDYLTPEEASLLIPALQLDQSLLS